MNFVSIEYNLCVDLYKQKAHSTNSKLESSLWNVNQVVYEIWFDGLKLFLVADFVTFRDASSREKFNSNQLLILLQVNLSFHSSLHD